MVIQLQDRTLETYKCKYEMRLESFLTFLQEKVDIDSYKIGLIKQKALGQLNIQEGFSQDSLRLLLRLIGMVQQDAQKAKNATKSTIQNFKGRIVYRTSKKKSSSSKINNSQIQQSSIQQQNTAAFQKKKSQSYQTERRQQKQQKAPESVIQRVAQSPLYQEIEIDDDEQQQQPEQKPYNDHPNLKAQKNTSTTSQKSSSSTSSKKQQKKSAEFKAESQESIGSKSSSDKTQQSSSKAVNPHKPSSSSHSVASRNSTEKDLKVVIQQEATSQVSLQQQQEGSSERQSGPVFLDMDDTIQSQKHLAKIVKFQKFSTDYVNTVIKYTIEYKGYTVLRRYSEFEKLMNHLNTAYQGFMLPELPPKEGIKGGISYFTGVDGSFLNDRKAKLEEMLNRILGSKFIKDDTIFLKFLTDDDYEIQCADQGYGAYIKTFADIAFNAKQLKDYGVAYCNYLREKSNVKLNPELQHKYEEIQQLVVIFMELNQYRKKINQNFDKRRELMVLAGIQCRLPQDVKFNKSMDLIEEEIKSLNAEYDKYRKIKPRESWLEELLKQKQSDGSKIIQQIKQEQSKLAVRIQKMEENFSYSLEDFKKTKSVQLQQIGTKMLEWRKRVHP